MPQPLSLKPHAAKGYQLVDGQGDHDHEQDQEQETLSSPIGSSAPHPPSTKQRTARVVLIALAVCLAICLGINFALENGIASRLANSGSCPCAEQPKLPDYFQTSPQMWAGPTATGRPAFMAQTRTFNPTGTYVPNAPLQTSIPIEGMGAGNTSIFQMMGYLSPYSPSPGFGVDEYPLPEGAEIVQVQMLSRHGSRYPTTGTNVEEFGKRIADAAGKYRASGPLSFLNDWKYQLGAEILVPRGRQELFESGILHSYMYGNLYNTNSKIIVRSTTQDRMLKSSEYFLAGFFGLEWTKNATIEVIIEKSGFNNSLAGYHQCPNAKEDRGGTSAQRVWYENYLQNATARFNDLIEGYEWSVDDTFAAQNMCPYETVSYGFSRFCDLFTYEEWIGFSYAIDLAFAGNNAFQSQTGRAVGIGWQQELLARLRNHTLGYSGSQINVTLDSSTNTFPLNQSLYFDFSHDTNIISVLTALGFKQFGTFLDAKQYPGPHNFTISHMVPFGARLDVEIIKTPRPVAADRSGYLPTGPATTYIHFILNQRTLPLGWSFPECDVYRLDGWCELDTFLKVQDEMEKLAKYDEACFGDYKSQPHGAVMDGAPL